MSVVVFCGPTLSAADVRREIDADVRPAAARGDVFEAATSRPDAIGLIDGLFDGVPSVWHKEVLWAMSEGVHVFGAASMGALRAAELDSFGMVGVGEIYEAYRSGALTDDDEVAVAHATAEHGYRSLSDAMVNVRATLRAACEAGVIGATAMTALERTAKALPFAERTYGRLLRDAASPAVSDGERERLGAFLARGRVDRKRADAIEMLRRLRAMQDTGWKPMQVDYVFARTHAWQSLERRMLAGAPPAAAAVHEAANARGVLEEAHLSADAGSLLDAAAARSACLEVARRLDAKVSPATVDAFIEGFRRERGLLSPAAFEEWLRDQGLGDGEAYGLFERESLVGQIRLRHAHERPARVLDHLRTEGKYTSLAERARRKTAWLSARGLEAAELRDTGLSEDALWKWHFVERLGQRVPGDLQAHAQARGATVEELRAMVVRDFLYVQGADE